MLHLSLPRRLPTAQELRISLSRLDPAGFFFFCLLAMGLPTGSEHPPAVPSRRVCAQPQPRGAVVCLGSNDNMPLPENRTRRLAGTRHRDSYHVIRTCFFAGNFSRHERHGPRTIEDMPGWMFLMARIFDFSTDWRSTRIFAGFRLFSSVAFCFDCLSWIALHACRVRKTWSWTGKD